MTKHIHIHLPKGVSLGRKTKDAGFNEADHPRDGGKFTAGQHQQAAGKHADLAVEARGQPGSGAKLHTEAAHAHSEAAEHVRTNHPQAAQTAAKAHAASKAAGLK